uniref:Colony stimulating factor 1b (macrophage) n=1 Tax=Astyanax mexicanus TaxID=7994 RepID=A0A3B1KL77_ASTMX
MSQMTQYNPVHIIYKAKVKSVCILVLFCLPFSMMDIAGPCKYSITKDHLLQMKHLINNQLQNGCSITYRFTERKNLSAVCYVKAALPHVLDLLSAHFRYARGSNSALLVQSLQKLILNIYSQHCVPVLNEELEEDPAGFEVQFTDSPVRALRRAEEVLGLYLHLITHTNTFVDWTCESEYSSHTADPQLSTELTTTTGTLYIHIHISSHKQTKQLITHLMTKRFNLFHPDAAQGLLGKIHLDSSDEKFYRLGFIVLSIMSGGILLILTVYCFVRRKVRLSRELFFLKKEVLPIIVKRF